MSLLNQMRFIFNKNQKIKLSIMMTAILFGSVLELVGVTAVLPFINAILSPEKIVTDKYTGFFYREFGFQSTTYFTVFLAVMIVGIYIVKNIYLILLGDVQFRFTYNNQRRLSVRIMEIYMKQPYLFHISHNTAELNRNVTGDTQVFYRAVLAGLQLATDTSVCLVLFIFLFITDKAITFGISTLMLGFVLFYVISFKKIISRHGQKTRECSATMTKWILQAFGGIKEAKILNREPFFVDNYDRSYREYSDAQRKNNILALIPKPFVETLCIGGLLIIVSLKLLRGVDLNYFVPVITTFAVAAFKMLPSFNKITSNLGIIMFSKPSVDAVYEDLQRVERLSAAEHDSREEKENTDFLFEREIEIQDLKFAYPNTQANVLNGVSLTIPKNKSIAFIGSSGSGKTTLADIILGVLDPLSGAVLADGVNVHENLFMWHKKVGYIPQTIYLTDDTLRNNIAFGVEPDLIRDSQIWEALEHAQLKTFVESLEDGLDTVIGESGVRLSGGQRQRIGIARALYHNPEVLVLDEATSALDNDTEKAVMEAIDNLAGSKTLLIIAHRLSTIQNCQIVYEVKGGQVFLKERQNTV